MNIKYGTKMKVKGVVLDKKTNMIMLVDNKTDIKALDLETFELIASFDSIDDFKGNIEVMEIIEE